jgi:hypothetical protein
MKLPKLIVLLILAGLAIPTLAQENSWLYRRKVTGVGQEGWYSIILPPDIFTHTSDTFDDLRILSISNDTLEIPFVLNVKETEYESESVSLSIMNESRKDGIYYVTFLNSGKAINQIDLEFEEGNYFATVRLEGSQNNKQWFQVVDEQKVFSIDNSFEQYRYNELHFPVSNYDYFRVAIKSQLPLHFIRGSFRNYQERPGRYNTVGHEWKVKQDKRAKQTVAELKLDHYQPVSKITLDIPSNKDYYRSARIEIMADSFKTEKGWIKNYTEVYNGYFTSIHPNEVNFTNSLASEVRVTINNLDNAPLEIKDIKVEGPVVELTASLLSGPETFLYYGKKDSYKPSYDIEHFRDKIPSTTTQASLGMEETLIAPPEKVTAFFENKNLLYAIMFVIIGVLGFFTLRMMKAKPNTGV